MRTHWIIRGLEQPDLIGALVSMVRDEFDCLEDLIKEGIQQSLQSGYPGNAARYREMIERYGIVPALSKLVVSSEIQSGFKWLKNHNMLKWTCEVAVLAFREEFNREVVAAAEFRILNADNLA